MIAKEIPETLTLDASIWRCGSKGTEGKTALHKMQDTSLLNYSGSMCCLGQFANQLGASKVQLKTVVTPESTGLQLPLLTNREKLDSVFSKQAMQINDASTTTIGQKVRALSKLCSKYGVKLITKNFTKAMLK
jgi:hypothetical protein